MMHKRKFLILAGFFLIPILNPGKGFAQVWSWANGVGGSGNEASLSMVLDNEGNVYHTGYFSGTVDFDPDSDVYELTATGVRDGFVAKSDSNGNFIWAKALHGTGTTLSNSISIDSHRNIYVTGYFDGTADLDPNLSIHNAISAGFFDLFICKLDSAGNFEWAKSIGGTGDDRGRNIVVDSSQNILAVGFFSGIVDFDPSSNVHNLNGLNSGIFITKFDSAGIFLWGKALSGSGGTNTSNGLSICIGNTSDVYLTGNFYGIIDFDPGIGNFTLSSTGTYDVFITKLDSGGNFKWAKTFTNTASSNSHDIEFDQKGFLYIVGSYSGTVDFDPGNAVFNLASLGNSDVFISKLTDNGNLVWVKSFGGSSSDDGYSIEIDGNNNIYATGIFRASVDFDPNVGVHTLTSNGNWDIYLIRLDQDGNFRWVKGIGGLQNDGGSSVQVSGSQRIYICGYFSSQSISFDVINLLNANQMTSTSDAFIAKLDDPNVLPVNLISFSAMSNNNKSYLEWHTDNEINAKSFEIQHKKNDGSFETIGIVMAVNSPGKNSYRFIHNNPALGINYYRLRQVDIDMYFKYSKVIKVRFHNRNTSVYPNPVNSSITIIPVDTLKHIEVFDISGKKILDLQPSRNNSYNLETLTSGNYFLKLLYQNSSEVIPLIK